jgi:hypothetical protein
MHPGPAHILAQVPDGPLCRHLLETGLRTAADVLSTVGAVRPFGLVLGATGETTLVVPDPEETPTDGLLEAVDAALGRALDAGAPAGARVDAVTLRTDDGRSLDAVRVVLRRARRPTLLAFQVYEGGPPEVTLGKQWIEADEPDA